MNFLDVRTVLTVGVAVTSLCALVIAWLWRQHRRGAPGLELWLADALLLVLGNVLVAGRGAIPVTLSILSGTPLFIGAALLGLCGLYRYFGVPVRRARHAALFGATVAAQAWFTLVVPSLHARNLVLSLALLVVCAQCAWLVLRPPFGAVRSSGRLLGGTFVAYGVVSVGRVVFELSAPAGSDLFRSGPYNAAVILVYSLLLVALTFGLFLMVAGRLQEELRQDIARRERAEDELRASEARFRSLVENQGEGVTLVAPDETFAYASPAAERIFGVAPGTLAGRGLGEFAPAEEFARHWRAAAGGPDGRAATHETTIRRADGGRAHLLVTATPQRAAGGGLLGVYGIVVDITARKEAELASQRLAEHLRRADRLASVGTLAAGAAHEINNPLACVAANLDFAVEELTRAPRGRPPAEAPAEVPADVPAEVIEALREAQDGAARVARIVRELKVFAQADEEGLASVDVEGALDAAIAMAQNEIRHRARLERERGGVPPVQANEARLVQVFLNLLLNAAQAIPEGHADRNRIAVRTHAVGAGRVEVEVRDTGAGMAPEVLARVFDPFYTTKPVGQGMGLGLSVCQGIVAALGGEIHVESAAGNGSTFRVVLPADTAAVVPADSAAATASRSRVLVIDDELPVARAVRRLLAGRYDVTIETDAAQALARLNAGEHYDVVLTDLMMPDLSGMELHREIAARLPEILRRIVFMTGGAFTPHAREFLESVPNRRLEKPLDPGELTAAVAAVAGESAAS